MFASCSSETFRCSTTRRSESLLFGWEVGARRIELTRRSLSTGPCQVLGIIARR